MPNHPWDSMKIPDQKYIEPQKLIDSNIAAIFPLHWLGVLSCQGNNVATFLQGQLTCDIRGLSENHSLLGGYSNIKGRLISSFVIAQQADAINLILPQNMLDTTQHTMQRYAAFSKITLQKNPCYAIGLYGDSIHQVLQQHWDTLPEEDFQAITQDQDTLIRYPGPQSRFIWLTTHQDNLTLLWPHLAENAAVCDHNGWNYLDIISRLALIEPNSSGKFLPQVIDYQRWGALSFDKGCYLGQEIIARTHHLGTLKRHLYHVQSHEALSCGQDIRHNNQVIGTIVLSAAVADRYHALAVMQDKILNTIDSNQLSPSLECITAPPS